MIWSLTDYHGQEWILHCVLLHYFPLFFFGHKHENSFTVKLLSSIAGYLIIKFYHQAN